MTDEPVLNLDNIQGGILPGFRKDSQHFIFLRITDEAAARTWLKSLAPRISSASEVRQAHQLWKAQRRRLGRDPDNVDFLFLNCALTANGLRKLGVDGVEQFDDAAFKLGLEARAGGIGDPPASSGLPGAPDAWLFGAGRRQVDVLVTLAADDQQWVVRAERDLVDSARGAGLQRVHVDRGRVRPGDMAGHEHFGFKDGVSIPAIRGRTSPGTDDFVEPRRWPADSAFDDLRQRFAEPGRPLIWPGHFLFGQLRQKRDDPTEPRPSSEPPGPAWARDGSFLVYRRLAQNVLAFHSFLKIAAEKLREQGFAPDLTPQRLGALLVGRWESGWPIMRDDKIDRGPNQPGENYFTFSEATTIPLPDDPNPLNPVDPNGRVCPFAAHIRKVQPRDDSTDIGGMERTFQKAILRRGITFGPELTDADAERGLLFVSFQTSIVEQFEFLMSEWVNQPNKPHSGGGVDPVISTARNATIKISNGQAEFDLEIPGGWVFATGGAYLFAPGIQFFTDHL